jgi:hypothetical protein
LDPALEGTAATSLYADADLVDGDLGTIGHEKAPHLYEQVRGICGGKWMAFKLNCPDEADARKMG